MRYRKHTVHLVLNINIRQVLTGLIEMTVSNCYHSNGLAELKTQNLLSVIAIQIDQSNVEN